MTTAEKKKFDDLKKKNSDLTAAHKKDISALKSHHKKELSDLDVGIKKTMDNNLKLVADKQNVIDILKKENSETKVQLTNALKNPVVSDEVRENIKQEALTELQAEIDKKEDDKEEVEKIAGTTPFFPADEITVKGKRFKRKNNSTGYCGAFNEMDMNVQVNLCEAMNIPTEVAEIPEENQKGDEIYIVYEGVMTQQAAGVQLDELKTDEDGEEKEG